VAVRGFGRLLGRERLECFRAALALLGLHVLPLLLISVTPNVGISRRERAARSGRLHAVLGGGL
jgi:hypothetical protein